MAYLLGACKRSYDSEQQLSASKQARISTNNDKISTRCLTAYPTSANSCERFVEDRIGLKYQRAQVETSLLVGLSSDAVLQWQEPETILEYMRADPDSMTATQCPCTLHQTLCIRLLEVMCHNDTQDSTAASCSAVLHESLTTAPGSWQPLQMSNVMQMIHSLAAAPARKLVVLADALSMIHQAIRDAARLGVGPVILLTDTVSSAELYRQPLAAALDVYLSWGCSFSIANLSTLSHDRAVLYSNKGRACTAALRLAGSIGHILVEQGRLTRVRAAEVYAAAY
jgi:hypothetical protein